MKNNIKNIKEDTLQGMRVVRVKRGRKEDINENREEKSLKDKMT